MPTRKEFETEIQHLFLKAVDLGFEEITINAGNLHRRVGGYPGPNHQMPVCCGAMRDASKQGDTELPNGLKKDGASFSVRYQIRHG